jgi:hypothetical protein
MNMKKVKISVDLSDHKFSDKDLTFKAEYILTCLTGNPNFPTLSDQLVDLKTKNDNFRSLLGQMEEGNRKITPEKNQAREDLEKILRSLAWKIQEISDGDETIIRSSGFEINRTPSPVGVLEQPISVIVKQGPNSRSLLVSWNSVDHAISYEVRFTIAPLTGESVFTTVTATKCSTILVNLNLKESYLIQVAGVGSDPTRVWSVAVISGYVS